MPRSRPEASIRQAIPADEAFIVGCVEAAYEKYVPRIGKPPAPMLADYASLIRAGVVHVLEHRGAPAGVIVMAPGDGHLFVENVAVVPSHHGLGLGRALMAFAEAEALRRGFTEVRLYTHERMTENLGFYRRLGYRVTGRREEDGYRRVYFRKRLTHRPRRPA
ncbi:MAG: GNAT family N-acetyltransferase [Kiloniellales bacterium]